MEKQRINPELSLPDVLKWKVPINWDPVPWWFFDRVTLPKEALSQLAVMQLEHEKAILQQNIKAMDQSIEVIKQFGSK
jgi:hypothetical protein